MPLALMRKVLRWEPRSILLLMLLKRRSSRFGLKADTVSI